MIVGTSVGWCGACASQVIVRTESVAACRCGASTLRYGQDNSRLMPPKRPALRVIKGGKP